MPPTIVDPWIPAWPDIDYIDQELDSGQYTSMTNIEILDYFDDPVERPAVAYYDESDGDLMFAIYY